MSSATAFRQGIYQFEWVRRLALWLDAMPHVAVVIELAPDRVHVQGHSHALDREEADPDGALHEDGVVVSPADVGERYAGTLSGAMNMTGSLLGAVGMAIAGRLLHRGLDDLVFILFACSYSLAAICWLAVDVTKPLVPRAE